MIKAIGMALDLLEKKETVQLKEEVDPMAFLRKVYLDNELPLGTRMRAAIELMPFMHPKLQVTAQITDHDIATLLDRRIARFRAIQEGKLIEPPLIEAQPIEAEKPKPHVPDRRFRRF